MSDALSEIYKWQREFDKRMEFEAKKKAENPDLARKYASLLNEFNIEFIRHTNENSRIDKELVEIRRELFGK